MAEQAARGERMIERLKGWILRRFGYSRYLQMAAEIEKALHEAEMAAYEADEEIESVTAYVGDFGVFRLSVRREPKKRYIGEPFTLSENPRLRGKRSKVAKKRRKSR
jgi:hypothetical protein